MPRFEPFRGLRFAEHLELDEVSCPPYDVISPADRVAFAQRSPHNAVRVELPEADGGADRYQVAARTLTEWERAGVLVTDDEPSFYVYRMGFHDEAGRPRQTTGVIGALELAVPGEGDVLPHERTMPKPKGDRLDLLRATGTNVSPIWGLSMTAGLSGLLEEAGPPTARATDADGVHHRLHRVSAGGVVAAIAEAVGSSPVVIADGHHRYQTALDYQAERHAAGVGAGGHDLVMTYVVELADEQLSVRAIHRLIAGLPEGTDLPDALSHFFEVADAGVVGTDVTARMDEAGALCLVGPGRRGWFLRPKPETEAAAEFDLDSSRLAVALATLPDHDLSYQHGADLVTSAVEAAQAQWGVLVRPATVGQILETGRARTLMPEKTTFFWPKPLTGPVLRRL